MEQLSRRIAPITLLMLSLNSIIGSGWLFAPLYAAKIAGPGALLSWVIGGGATLLIAFAFAELSTLFPVAGGSAHIPHLSHGPFASFILGWIAWITALMLAPIEVQAVLQYAALYFPSLMYEVNNTPVLSTWGYVWAAILMVSLCLINILSYKGLMRFNFILFIFKFGIIVLTIFLFYRTRFDLNNFSGFTHSITTYTGWQAIFSAAATGGIVLAFNGFKSGVEMAGEAKNLKVAIPLSTIGSVLCCLVLYLCLQVCFIGALDAESLKNGWSNLNFNGDLGPFVGLAAALGLFFLLKLLYLNAVVSPLGAGLIYVTATARILYALSRMGFVPRFISQLNRQRLPVYAIIINFSLGMLSFLPLPGWQSMVNFLVSAMVITYAMGPIAVVSLRYNLPDRERPFRLPAAHFLCLFAFYFCNLFSYWTGWDVVSKLSVILILGVVLFIIAYARKSITIKKCDFLTGIWIIPYLSGLSLISYLGSFGGRHVIPFGWDFLIIGLFSIAIFYTAIASRAALSTKKAHDYLLMQTQQLS